MFFTGVRVKHGFKITKKTLCKLHTSCEKFNLSVSFRQNDFQDFMFVKPSMSLIYGYVCFCCDFG